MKKCLRCGSTGYQPSYQHPMQVVMQDECAHICSACGYTWPREGRDQPYRERYGEPTEPYGLPDAPTEGDTPIRDPDWCENCQEDTPTIGYRQYKEQPERRCAMCGRPKVLSSEA